MVILLPKQDLHYVVANLGYGCALPPYFSARRSPLINGHEEIGIAVGNNAPIVRSIVREFR